MAYALTLVTAPTVYPVTLEEARAQLRDPPTEEDGFIADDLIPSATAMFQDETRRQFMLATWDLALPRFWGGHLLSVPRPPLLAVTSITYVDADGASQALSSSVYGVLTKAVDSPFGGIYLKSGQSWPQLYGETNALEVTVRFTCGYSSSATAATQRAAVPVIAKKGVKLLIAELMANRGDGDGGSRDLDRRAYGSCVSQLAVPMLEHELSEAA